MDINERELLISYYDFYKGLLTDKQCLYFEQYYLEDFSFAEIATENDVSRNAVFDQIKKTIAILEHYEEILKLNYKYSAISEALKEEDINKLKNKINSIIEE